jgi:ferredoxin--NADP+ reductase/benzoate/toluate 1,2-dioxygenase reductase subunit
MEKIVEKPMINQRLAEVISVRLLTESTYVLRFYRNDFNFQAGQYLVLGLPGNKQKREYSIYSSDTSPYLEVLIKEVEDGFLSKKLKHLNSGDFVEVEGPFGYFVLDERKIPERKFLFIASGTGISPFHSMVMSNPHMDYTLLHGVKSGKEGYDRHEYEKGRYIQCTSRDDSGDFHGRVTNYLLHNPISDNTWVYLCGNSAMIDDAYGLLEQQGIASNYLHAEVYF